MGGSGGGIVKSVVMAGVFGAISGGLGAWALGFTGSVTVAGTTFSGWSAGALMGAATGTIGASLSAPSSGLWRASA